MNTTAAAGHAEITPAVDHPTHRLAARYRNHGRSGSHIPGTQIVSPGGM